MRRRHKRNPVHGGFHSSVFEEDETTTEDEDDYPVFAPHRRCPRNGYTNERIPAINVENQVDFVADYSE